MPTMRKWIDISARPSLAEPMHLTGVLANEIGLVWAEVVPLITPALGEDDTLAEVLSDLLRRRAQLWISGNEDTIEAACVTEIVIRGEKKYCNVWLTGGHGVNNWLHHLDTIEEWAKEKGCDAMTIDRARLGWKRLLPKYTIRTVTLVKDI